MTPPPNARWWLAPAIMWGVTLIHFVISVGCFAYAIDAAIARKATGLQPGTVEQVADLAWRILQYPIAWLALRAPGLGQLLPPNLAWAWWFANSLVWGFVARLAYTRYAGKRTGKR